VKLGEVLAFFALMMVPALLAAGMALIASMLGAVMAMPTAPW